MIGPHFFNLHGVKAWAGMLKDLLEHSHCFHGRYSDSGLLWPRTALYYHFGTRSIARTLLEAIPA